MLSTFFNKTAHPILNRYHHNRMTEGINLIKQMDAMIDKLNKNKTIDSEEQDGQQKIKLEIKQRVSYNGSYSKGIMKRIINNQTWNDLIDRKYNHSLMNKSEKHDERHIQRSKSLNSSNVFNKNKVNFPNLNTSQTMTDKPINKIKKAQINMIQYFTPSPKVKKQNFMNTKMVKPPLKSTKRYKARQLQWQSKHLSHYDEQKAHEFQTPQ